MNNYSFVYEDNNDDIQEIEHSINKKAIFAIPDEEEEIETRTENILRSNVLSDDLDLDSGLSDEEAAEVPEPEIAEGAGPDIGRGKWRTQARNEWRSISEIIFQDDKTAIEDSVTQFSTYLDSSHTIFDDNLTQLYGLNLWNWEELLDNPTFASIAEIALRLKPTPASEASAERYISLQRLVIVPRRNRAHQDLTDARISLLKKALSDSADSYVAMDIEGNRTRIKKVSKV